MNQKLLLFCLLLTAQYSLFAQADGERVQAFRTAVLVEELQLTDIESDAFFPIYQQYTEKRRALQQEHRSLQRQLAVVSDEEAEAKIEQLFRMEEAEIDLKRQYFKQFLTVLPIRKVIRIPVAEREFKRQLLDKARDRRRRQ